MRKPWHEANPAFYDEVMQQVEAAYPDLHFVVHNNVVFLSGSFPLKDGERIVDRYSIEVAFPPNYPCDLPLVWEIGGRIPRTADRHIYTNGATCLFVLDERAWICPEGTSLLDFLNGPVRNFFLGQSLFEIDGVWPFGQRSHGVQGILEFYAERLDTNDKSVIIRYLDVLRKKDLKGHWRCPCGSGKRLRKCHMKLVVELHEKIPHTVALQSWQRMSDMR